jgi:ribonucleoside-triphosphate reductase
MNANPCPACTSQACDICIKRPKNKCGQITEIFSRVCGYHRPIKNWNKGKREEFRERKNFISKYQSPSATDPAIRSISG